MTDKALRVRPAGTPEERAREIDERFCCCSGFVNDGVHIEKCAMQLDEIEAYAAEAVADLKVYIEGLIAGRDAAITEAVASEREACVADAGDIWGDGEQLAKRRAFRARGGEKP